MKHVTSFGVAALLATAISGSLTAQDLLVQAKTIMIAPGSLLTDSAILVRDGKVAYVGDDIPAEARSNARRVDYGDATITPGLVLASSTLGRDNDLAETAFAFTPDLRAVEAFDPWQKQLLKLPSYGVTSLGLAPSDRNVAGGIGALVKSGKDQGRVATDEAFVGFSVTQRARSQQRQPTSLMGAKEMLRDAFHTAKVGVQVGPDLAVIRQVISGARRAIVHADTFAELNAVLELAETYTFAPVIVGGAEADRLLPRLAKVGASLVLPTLRPDARLATLTMPAKLAEAGVAFCFAGDPRHLRLSAALAVRHGLDRQAAHNSLTRVPAQLLGQSKLVGSLRQGCGADFVVHHGDLLDLASPHIATWIDGELVSGKTAAGALATQNTMRKAR